MFTLLTNARSLFLYKLLLYWYATPVQSNGIKMFTNLPDLTDMRRERFRFIKYFDIAHCAA